MEDTIIFGGKSKMEGSQHLSIVIPAYNEAERLGNTIEAIIDFMELELGPGGRLDGLISAYDISVVDDGSSDSTCEIASSKANCIRQPKNLGKGAAVRRGMLEARGGLILFSDADLSTPIHELINLMERLATGFDIAIGSRGIDYGKIKKHQPAYREFMGKAFNKIVQFLAIKGLRDTQCGFKLFTNNAANNIFSKAEVDGFGFDVEVLFLADRLGYKIAEVPVEWHNDERTTVNPILDPIKMLLDIIKLKRKHGKIKA
ncbi:MAG: glycosyltransferase family 2 protein [Candidatus Kapaibacteriales bacterium]